MAPSLRSGSPSMDWTRSTNRRGAGSRHSGPLQSMTPGSTSGVDRYFWADRRPADRDPDFSVRRVVPACAVEPMSLGTDADFSSPTMLRTPSSDRKYATEDPTMPPTPTITPSAVSWKFSDFTTDAAPRSASRPGRELASKDRFGNLAFPRRFRSHVSRSCGASSWVGRPVNSDPC